MVLHMSTSGGTQQIQGVGMRDVQKKNTGILLTLSKDVAITDRSLKREMTTSAHVGISKSKMMMARKK